MLIERKLVNAEVKLQRAKWDGIDPISGFSEQEILDYIESFSKEFHLVDAILFRQGYLF